MTRFSRCFRASPLLLISLTACARAEPPKPDAAGFIVKPYVQLGNVPKMGETESLTILWQTQDTEGDWTVEANGKRFTAKPQRVALVDVTPVSCLSCKPDRIIRRKTRPLSRSQSRKIGFFRHSDDPQARFRPL